MKKMECSSILGQTIHKMPVGINAIEEQSFSNHTFQLLSDDLIYIFSDGYADQFGGPGNKKYKYGRFKELLTRLSIFDLSVQKEELLKEFLNWKGNNEQVDDILVIGLKFM
jgi:serine phosphatase RsbU (regulator of sigma subunit)